MRPCNTEVCSQLHYPLHLMWNFTWRWQARSHISYARSATTLKAVAVDWNWEWWAINHLAVRQVVTALLLWIWIRAWIGCSNILLAMKSFTIMRYHLNSHSLLCAGVVDECMLTGACRWNFQVVPDCLANWCVIVLSVHEFFMLLQKGLQKTTNVTKQTSGIH